MKLLPALTVLLLLASCNSNDANADIDTESLKPLTGIAAPQTISLNIIGIYNHDTSAYTQGLEIHNGKLYESTGDFENSSLRITDVKTGKVIQKFMMGSAEVFGEGITIFNNKIYQLTWKNNLVNVYDVSNIEKPIKTFNWPYQGWGITHTNTELIISDGSANLYFVNPEDFKLKNTLQVIDNVGPISELNELEFIDGFIFANVYGRDHIIKIDPSNGHVVGRIDLPGLMKQYAKGFVPDANEVLNGIAWDSINKTLYFTGKRWPKLFEARIN